MICILPIHITMGTWLVKVKVKVGGCGVRWIKVIPLQMQPATPLTFIFSLFNRIWWRGTNLFMFWPLWSLVVQPYLVGHVIFELAMLNSISKLDNLRFYDPLGHIWSISSYMHMLFISSHVTYIGIIANSIAFPSRSLNNFLRNLHNNFITRLNVGKGPWTLV